MKTFAKIIVALYFGFVGWCLYTGSEAEDRREAIIMQQQAHDLQQMRKYYFFVSGREPERSIPWTHPSCS